MSLAAEITLPTSAPVPESTRWFAEEVQPHEGALRSYLRRKLGSSAEVDDVVQDSYLRIWRARLDGLVRTPRAFLFRIAHNAAVDRRRRRDVAKLEPLPDDTSANLIDAGPYGAELVGRREELALLGEAIRALPERCREVFLLRKIRGLSQREIAARLGVTENTVETLAARGARRCADYLRARMAMSGSPDAR